MCTCTGRVFSLSGFSYVCERDNVHASVYLHTCVLECCTSICMSWDYCSNNSCLWHVLVDMASGESLVWPLTLGYRVTFCWLQAT